MAIENKQQFVEAFNELKEHITREIWETTNDLTSIIGNSIDYNLADNVVSEYFDNNRPDNSDLYEELGSIVEDNFEELAENYLDNAAVVYIEDAGSYYVFGNNIDTEVFMETIDNGMPHISTVTNNNQDILPTAHAMFTINDDSEESINSALQKALNIDMTAGGLEEIYSSLEGNVNDELTMYKARYTDSSDDNQEVVKGFIAHLNQFIAQEIEILEENDF